MLFVPSYSSCSINIHWTNIILRALQSCFSSRSWTEDVQSTLVPKSRLCRVPGMPNTLSHHLEKVRSPSPGKKSVKSSDLSKAFVSTMEDSASVGRKLILQWEASSKWSACFSSTKEFKHCVFSRWWSSCFVLLFWNRISKPGCPSTPYEVKNNTEFRIILILPPLLGWQVYTTVCEGIRIEAKAAE